MKTRLYNFDPIKPHFYIVKLGFTRVHIIFLISTQKHWLWYSLEPPRRAVLTSITMYVLTRNMKNIRIFYLIFFFFLFLVVKFSVYLNRHVFVMWFTRCVETTALFSYVRAAVIRARPMHVDHKTFILLPRYMCHSSSLSSPHGRRHRVAGLS